MNEKTHAIFFIIIAVALLTTFTITSAIVKAASMSDNNSTTIIPKDNGINNNNNTSTITPQSTDRKMFLTAVPEKSIITRGTTETVDISAKTDNGTGIPDVDIQSIIVDYSSGHHKTILGGTTDDKGNVKVSAQIGPHAHPGQFLVTVQGVNDKFDTAQISTGFAVSAATKSSSGSCSGSSCR